MKTTATNYRGYRFPPEIISHGVGLYHRFCLSFRDVEDLLAKRGILVSYETGQAVVSEVRTGVRPEAQASPGGHTLAVGYGRAEKLRRCPSRYDAFRELHHGTLREQSSGGIASTDTTTRASDATLQVSGPSSAFSFGPRGHPESLQILAPPDALGELSMAAGTLLQRLESGHCRLSKSNRIPASASPRPL